MDYTSIYLSREELRRFLEIANGDTTASNTPEEDALFRKKLIEERMLGFIQNDTGETSTDMRAVVLTDLGKEYFAQHMNKKKDTRRNFWQYLITTAIAAISVIATVLIAIFANK